MQKLASHVLGMDALCFGNVVGSGDDGPAVGEHGQHIAIHRKSQQELVLSYFADTLEFLRDCVKRQICTPIAAQLHGVAAAEHGCVISALAIEPRKLAAAAGRAIVVFAQRIKPYLTHSIIPQVNHG